MDPQADQPQHPLVARYMPVHEEMCAELELAFAIRKCLVDSPFAFCRLSGYAALLRLLRSLPPEHDLLACLQREECPPHMPRNIVAAVLKHTFPTAAQATKPTPLEGAVTWHEKELVLRLCQGICAISPSQRLLVSETHFLSTIVGELTAAAARTDGATTPETPPPYGADVVCPADAPRYRVVLAAVDALEAACHYNSPLLWRFTKRGGVCPEGGVAALMPLLRGQRVPFTVRSAVADFLCTLLTETAVPHDWIDRPVALLFQTEVRRHVAAIAAEGAAGKPAAPMGVSLASESDDTSLDPAASDHRAAVLYAQLHELRDHGGVALWLAEAGRADRHVTQRRDAAKTLADTRALRKQRFVQFLSAVVQPGCAT